MLYPFIYLFKFIFLCKITDARFGFGLPFSNTFSILERFLNFFPIPVHFFDYQVFSETRVSNPKISLVSIPKLPFVSDIFIGFIFLKLTFISDLKLKKALNGILI